MGKIFDLDSPVIQGLNKVADLMWLNLLMLICCIPIFTIGASLTAAHYVALKMRRNEEGYIAKDFFKSFKLNFKQSTLIWIIALLMIAVLSGDYYIIKNSQQVEIAPWVQVAVMAAGFLVAFTMTWVFPLQARFENRIMITIKNAFALGILQFPKTLLMIFMAASPLILYAISLRTVPIVLLFGLSVPVYVGAMLYNKTFKKLEDKILGNEETGDAEESDEEKIFSDTPNEEN